MSKKVLIIQHSENVRPAYVTTFFTEHHIPFEILLICDPQVQAALPALDTNEYSAIVSLGGHQATYEEDEYPYLKWEKAFLLEQISLERPILGICLGAQLIAVAIGGRGHLGKFGYELGYVDFRLTDEGKSDPVLSKVFAEQNQQPLLIMHHQDSFDLPAAKVSVLAYSSVGYIAVFRTGSAYCVQFHPEASFKEFREWVENTRATEPELYEGRDIDRILAQAAAAEERAEQSRRSFFESWWNSLSLSQHNWVLNPLFSMIVCNDLKEKTASLSQRRTLLSISLLLFIKTISEDVVRVCVLEWRRRRTTSSRKKGEAMQSINRSNNLQMTNTSSDSPNWWRRLASNVHHARANDQDVYLFLNAFENCCYQTDRFCLRPNEFD